MRLIRLTCAAAAVAICATIPVLDAQQNPESVTVNWSDPSRPGTLAINAVLGNITVRGSNRKDVLVTSREGAGGPRFERAPRPPRPSRPPAPGVDVTPVPTPEPRTETRPGQPQSDVPPGFRRLTPSRNFSLEERNNEIEIDAHNFMRNSDFEIEVPARTNLRLHTMTGRIVVEGVEGDIEVTGNSGPVTLTNVAGAVVASSNASSVTAVLSRVAADKAMSFTSFTGNVDVTLPASVKANLKMLSNQGDVFTDFDVQTRTPTPSAPSRGRGNRAPAFHLDETIYGSINGGGPEIELRTFTGRVLLRRGK